MLKNILKIDFLQIIKDDFIDFETDLKNKFNNGFLYEDMFLGKSNLKNLYIDIGWVSSDDSFENGYFKILIIENDDWELPLINLRAIKKVELIQKIELALLFFKKYELITSSCAKSSK
jgi:hypothetical protein